MYNKLFNETCGMFNALHFLAIGVFFLLLAAILFLGRKLTAEQVRKMLPWIAIFITILEIVKITLRIQQGYGPDSWVPLYYCSLFIFAIWLSVCRVEPLQRAGYAYLTMGGILASAFFIFYPSTSYGMYPFLHPSSLHSFFYHLIMCTTGLLVLRSGAFVPRKKDAMNYFALVFAACLAAVPLNEQIGTNCMFLRHPFNLPLLQPLCDACKPAYMLLVALAQSAGMFWMNYGLYRMFSRKKKNRKAAFM